jgi:hypothetical protein
MAGAEEETKLRASNKTYNALSTAASVRPGDSIGATMRSLDAINTEGKDFQKLEAIRPKKGSNADLIESLRKEGKAL